MINRQLIDLSLNELLSDRLLGLMINNRLLITAMSAAHRFIYNLTGGAIGNRIKKASVLLLTTTGRKTGKQRTTPLQYMREGDDFVIVASNAGDDQAPNWWKNLQGRPLATIQVKGDRYSVKARTATNEEKARLWPLLVDMYQDYDEYQRRTKREIPVVILHPAE